MKKLIINLTPTGMVPTKEMNIHTPVSPEEVISDVCRCIPLGVSMIHLHARDERGIPTYRKDIYGELIKGIRKKYPELVLVSSLSGRRISEFEKRAEALDLEGEMKPDMGSLTLSSLNFPGEASCNSPEVVQRLAAKMKDRGIKPELEVFDLGMVNYAHYLIKKGLLDPPYYFNILLGNIATAQAKLLHLGLIVSELPPDSYWSVAGIGDFQKPMNGIGIIMGDGVRVGLEDNIWYDDERKIPATNYSLVERITKIASAFERPLATPQDVREMLNIPMKV